MSVNTVALDSERKPILYTEEIPALITKADIDFCSGNGYPGSISVMIQGPVLLTLTNIRLIIVPENDLVKSLDIPLFKLQECVLVRPMFGSRRITATVLPISDGGLPENGQMTIKFPSGNAFEFKTFFDELSAQTAGQMPYVESLPLYNNDPVAHIPQEQADNSHLVAPPDFNEATAQH